MTKGILERVKRERGKRKTARPNEKMYIDVEIVGVRGEYLEGVVVGKKFPWYNLRVYDELSPW